MQDDAKKEMQALIDKDLEKARNEFNDKLLRAVLERCIEAGKEALGPSVRVSYLLLCCAGVKGQEMKHLSTRKK
jgi:hypothetical protein